MSDATGEAPAGANDTSVEKFVSSVTFNASIFIGLFLAFCYLRKDPLFRTIYSPRTFLVEGKARSDPLPNSYFGWIRPLLILDQETIVSRVGLDAYTFLRFLRIGFVLFASASVFAVPVLVPINAISADGLAVGYSMNRLTVGNVLDGDRRLIAHLFMSACFAAGTITLIIRELRSFLQLRYQVLTSPEHLADVGSRTVLVHNVPRNSASPEKLKDIFSLFPGGVVTVSVYQDVGGLPGLVKQRDTCLTKLERLETHYIADANRILAGQRGKAQAAQLSKSVAETDGAARTLASQLDKPQAARHPKSAVETDHHTVEMQDFQRIDPVSFPRPQHITGGIRRFLPFCSTQSARVDAISYFRQKYQVLADRVQTQRELLFGAHLSAAHQSAFITFRYQYAAHLAAQSVISVDPETFTPRVVDVSPDDVVYANLNIDARIRRIRRLIGISASAALAVFWSIPTFIVSSIASLDKMADYVPFLEPLKTWNGAAKGVIQGVLPPAAVAILMSFLPKILTFIAVFEGLSTKSSVNLSLQSKYYLFLVFQVLLLQSVSSGGFAVVDVIFKELDAVQTNPWRVVDILAEKLPTAATLLITYVLLAALTGMGKEILQPPILFTQWLLIRLRAKSPRDVFSILAPRELNYGMAFAEHSLIFTIGCVYSTIAPVVLIVCAMYFALAYLTYLHNCLYTYRNDVNANGLHFACAAVHVFNGLTIHQLTLAGLLALKKRGDLSATAVILALLTVVARVYIENAYSKQRTRFLPVDAVSRDSRFAEEASDTAAAAPEQEGAPLGPKTCSPPPDFGAAQRPAEAAGSMQARPSSKKSQRARRAAPLPTGAAREASPYQHSALRENAPVVWIPEDRHGVAVREVAELAAHGIAASSANSRLDDRTGRVSISGPPPEAGAVGHQVEQPAAVPAASSVAIPESIDGTANADGTSPLIQETGAQKS